MAAEPPPPPPLVAVRDREQVNRRGGSQGGRAEADEETIN